MRASYICMLVRDMKNLGLDTYAAYDLNYKLSGIKMNNEAAINVDKCNKDTAGDQYVARRCHYVKQGTTLKETCL